MSTDVSLKVDFHGVEFSERTGNLLFTRDNVSLNLTGKSWKVAAERPVTVENSVRSET